MFDVAVIGGGPGGYVSAIKASQKGMKTLLAENLRLGGTCLNVGCIPTKSFLADVKKLKRAKHSQVITGSDLLRIDLNKMIERKESVVKALVGGLENVIKTNGVVVAMGYGEIVAQNKIRVKSFDGRVEDFESRNIIVATGSRTIEPAFLRVDGNRIITSDDALNLKEIPDSVIIIGGGVIGVEFAQIFGGLGSKVLVLEMLPDIIMSEDEQVRRELRKILEKEKIKISTDSRVTAVETAKDSVSVVYSNNQGKNHMAKAERVLVAVGRKPNTEGLGLEQFGLHTENKFITVNEYMETSVKGIYAIGDVIGGKMLAHAASAEGEVAVENISGNRVAMDYSKIPNCIYTCPEIASVGLTEVEAKRKGLRVKIGKFPYVYSGMAWAMEETDGFVKIIGDEKTGEILGVTIFGAHATDLIGECLLAMNVEATIEDLGKVVCGHPTFSEVVKEAALDWQTIGVHSPRSRDLS